MKELRTERINVRATLKMKDKLKTIKYYLNSNKGIALSDSETLEFILDYMYDLDWKHLNEKVYKFVEGKEEYDIPF